MSRGGKFFIGLIFFLAIISFPFVYNVGQSSDLPKPVLTEEAKAHGKCVESREYMRANHMQLLDRWRNTVVREGKSIYVNSEGKKFKMSLQNTCLSCHSNREQFCDRCHNQVKVKPYCWDCHLSRSKESGHE